MRRTRWCIRRPVRARSPAEPVRRLRVEHVDVGTEDRLEPRERLVELVEQEADEESGKALDRGVLAGGEPAHRVVGDAAGFDDEMLAVGRQAADKSLALPDTNADRERGRVG